MALDPSQVTETPIEAPSEVAASEPRPGFLATVLEKLRPASREDPGVTEELPSADETPSTPPPPSPTPPPSSWRPPSSPEEHERQVQAEVDRREYQRQLRERQAAEQAKFQHLSELKGRLREARRTEGDDSYSVATLAAQIDDLEQGVERERYDSQANEQWATQIALVQAARMHQRGLAPLLKRLPEAEVKKHQAWFDQQIQRDAEGRLPLTPDEVIGQLAERLTDAHEQHIRARVEEELVSDLKNNPHLRQVVMAALYGDGDYSEPEHLVSGTPAGLPTDEQLDRMTAAEYAALKLSPEDEARLLVRPRRS